MASWKERVLFLLVGLQKMGQVGSVLPSAPELVQAMLQDLPWPRVRIAVELGAGTGAITGAVLERLPPGAQFLVFEKEPEFRRYLAAKYPGLLLRNEALGLTMELAAQGGGQADLILSSIPFALLSPAEQEALLDVICETLAPEGCFVAFQYSLLLARRLRRRFGHVRTRFVPLNLPPAFVYHCSQPRATGTAGRVSSPGTPRD